jgi:flagellar motor switch protein FliN/FliY
MTDGFEDSPQLDPEQLEALLHDVPLEVTVELGRIRMNLADLAAHLGPGSIITLDTPTGAPLDVRVNNRLIARAEAIAVGEKAGIRIVELVGNKEP